MPEKLKSAARGLLKMQDAKNRQKSPSAHHRTGLSGHIFATEAHIDNRKKMLSSNISSTCPHSMVNFGPLAAEIVHTSPKARLTSAVIRIRNPDRQQNLTICSSANCQPSLKISCKSVRKFLRKVANRQTNNDDYISSLAAVNNFTCLL